jgi:hypothetical protein
MNTGWETARESGSSTHRNETGKRRSVKDRPARADKHRTQEGRTNRERQDRSDKEQRRKKRRRKRIITTTVIALLSVGLAVVIFMSVLRIRTLKAFSGDYTRTVDMTDRIVANAAIWLKDVEGADITTEWIMGKTDPLVVKTSIGFNPKGLKRGSFTEELDNPSYSECSDKAYKLTADCLRELLIKRLTMVGYAETVSDEEADSLIMEVLGTTLEDYIKNEGVAIMPDYNELAQEYTRTGDYSIDKMTIKWARDGEERIDGFRTTGDELIIVDPGYVYERSQ